MSLTTDRSVQTKPNREVVVEFSAAALRAPFALRCAALFIDYILIVAVPVLGLVIDRLIGGGPGKFSNNTAWFIAFLLGVSDLLIFPALSGQTLGMMMCRLRIVRTDGGDPSVARVIIRNTLGFLLTLLTLGFGFLLAVFTSNGRALHDYLAGTIVIFGSKRILK
jgi:uncharacterized RDD family membrane protein YckC